MPVLLSFWTIFSTLTEERKCIFAKNQLDLNACFVFVVVVCLFYFILFYLQIHANLQRYCNVVSSVSDFQMGENGWSKAAVSAITLSVFGLLVYMNLQRHS